MADILKPNLTSRENLEAFIMTIQDQTLQLLVREHMDDILRAGRLGPDASRAERDRFLEAVKTLINQKLEQKP